MHKHTYAPSQAQPKTEVNLKKCVSVLVAGPSEYMSLLTSSPAKEREKKKESKK
jgi:hypothetical protein